VADADGSGRYRAGILFTNDWHATFAATECMSLQGMLFDKRGELIVGGFSPGKQAKACAALPFVLTVAACVLIYHVVKGKR